MAKAKKDHKSKALHRVKVIIGHLTAIQHMIEDEKYCVDIVHQSRAVQNALKKLDSVIMEDHLKTCVIDQIKNNEEERTIEELMQLFGFNSK